MMSGDDVGLACCGCHGCCVPKWVWAVERGGLWNSQHDVLICTTVNSDDGMCHCHLDDMANLDGTIDMPRCLVMTWQWQVVAVVVAVCQSECGQLTMVVSSGDCR